MAIRRRKIFANVPISSMADIAFLLLIFFMVTSVLKVDADLPLILPDAGGQEIKEKDLQISVDRNKQFYFGNIAMDLDATVARVQEQIQLNPGARVVINAHDNLPVEVLDRLFEKLKRIGATNIAIVTKQENRQL
ncbi:MAG TPA: biopolymer transporter ExbD [Leptospiraceae bacterium]|nr:biopolymer transporter ExbD [Spirochaetaceae bacterium]HBS06348.1 biopolymer transporter ExbD [Leptospiraceae bacterium]|tara:strand:+ start:40539 stop:40943 length:405 start_codon:yes stop_codon:yes gene_type:complete